MNVVLMTREYPPEVYGGAGVHVAQLAEALGRRIPVEVRCFGLPREPSAAAAQAGGEGGSASGESGSAGLRVQAYGSATAGQGAPQHLSTLQTISINLSMAAGMDEASVVHSHTWYANLGGHAAKLLYSIPHVMTSHSLEPKRTWKAEQLGPGGHALSSFCERTAIEAADAVIAVSAQMRQDILECYPSVPPCRVVVIHNGVDAQRYRPDPRTDVLERYGVDPRRPSVMFVGRITRQKGMTHLLDAARWLAAGTQLVLCASAPDTPAIAREIEAKVAELRSTREGVIWIPDGLGREEVIQILSHASVFVCPSIYEPLGIVNLEAMACEVPVVATATGGIPEVVEEGVTGLLVPYEPAASGLGPEDPQRFARDLADRVNALLADPATATAMGTAGRRRVIERFSWEAAATRTIELYESLTS
jgi:starch synthase